MDTNTVVITAEFYNRLIKTSAEVMVLERMLNAGVYVSEDDLRAIFNIEKKEVKDA